MGYSLYINTKLFSNDENLILNQLINDFKIDKNKLLMNAKNNFLLKTGYPKEHYSLFQNYIKDKNKYYPFKLQEGGGSPDGNYRGKGGFNTEIIKHNELNNAIWSIRSRKLMHKTISSSVITDSFPQNNSKLLEKIQALLPAYKKNKIITITKNSIENTRRKMIIDDDNNINFKNNYCRNISDMKILFEDTHHNKVGILCLSDEYISQKSTGLVTFINSGIQKSDCLPQKDIEKCEITSNKGKLLLNTLGIDIKAFCQVFNNYANKNIEGISEIANEYNKELIFNNTNSNYKLCIEIQKLIKKSMGVGNMIISHEINNDDKVYRSKDKNMDLVSYQSYYGGQKSKGKRVDVEIKTNDMKFIFNIRNKQGDIYPSHLMCDFKYI